MDLHVRIKTPQLNRWLPYWAVFQMDMRQMARSWVFRVWIVASASLSVAYLLHRTAIHHQAGIIQQASSMMSEVLKFALIVGTTIVIVLTAGAISSERGIMADSVLSRGISRYQYFMGKWHARLVIILGSFFLVGLIILTGSSFLLQNDLSLVGSLIALMLVGAVFTIVVSIGVAVSSLCNSTLLAVALIWMSIYGVGGSLYLLQISNFNPARLFNLLPSLMQGYYNVQVQAALIGWCLLISLAAALVGLIHFSRRDV